MTATSETTRPARRLLPVILALALFAMGVYAFYHLLHAVNFADVRAQVRATPISIMVAASLASAAGYAALIGYDWWGLRYIGKQLPLPAVALGSFLGCAFGNTVGVSFISGGAVRYRIYSALGLAAFEVAALSTYIAVAMGIGLTLIGLGALALHPAALGTILPFSHGFIRVVSGALLLVSLAVMYSYSVTGKVLKIWRASIEIPKPSMLTGQLAVSLFDIMAASLTLWLLLPAGKPDFATFVAIYAAATMVGVLSHVPGGVGVFETAVLAAMPHGTSPSDTAAALILFRTIYFLLPFAVAFVLVSLNEARAAGGAVARMMGARSVTLNPVFGALTGVAPALVAVVAFGTGVLMIVAALVPSIYADALAEDDLVGAILTEGGTVVSAVAGVVLVILSHGLARRVEAAFWLAIIALVSGGIAAFFNDLHLETAIPALGGALALIPFRKAFYRYAKLTEGVFSPAWFALVGAVLIALVSFFFFAHAATPWSNDLLLDFSRNAATPRSLRAGLLASALLLFFTVFLSLRPVRPRLVLIEEEALCRAAQIVAQQSRPSAALALTGDKALTFSDDGRGFIMYGRQRSIWAAFGDPVGPADTAETLAWDFFDEARRANCQPVFYEVGTDNLPLWIEMGMSLHKVGEEAIVNLREFSLSGSKFKTMRAAYNKKQREGLDVEVLSPPHAPELIAELKTVSDAWLNGKAGREKGFSVGRFDPAYLDRCPIAVVREEGRALAFANILVASNGARIAIDLMRYLPEKASGIMEFLFLSLIEHYREAGADEFSLGVAPLSGLTNRPTARMWNGMGRMIFRHGGTFYNFEGLRAFKQKFRPDWQPRYIVLPPGLMPIVALADIALLISGSAPPEN